MNVSVLIPYRPFDNYRREHILRFVKHRMELGFPDWEIVFGIDDPNDLTEPFNRSRALNEAARNSYGDVLLICDADTICNETYLWQALKMIESGASWVFPYEMYYNLNQAYSDKILGQMADRQWKRPSDTDVEFALDYVVSGMLMVRRDLFETVGGFDEKFIDWGYEDDAFNLMLTAFGGESQRVPEGFVTHIWHPPGLQFESPYIDSNRALFREYKKRRYDNYALKVLKES